MDPGIICFHALVFHIDRVFIVHFWLASYNFGVLWTELCSFSHVLTFTVKAENFFSCGQIWTNLHLKLAGVTRLVFTYVCCYHAQLGDNLLPVDTSIVHPSFISNPPPAWYCIVLQRHVCNSAGLQLSGSSLCRGNDERFIISSVSALLALSSSATGRAPITNMTAG